ncbi:ATP-binding protein [Oceanirhabdus seepicola]|uniref:histidine kinase n=1 Tax=Oceanirhabdus seepicola TaxID=2828781 RepID=A0A9J6P3H3_9CLOT|nr:ATP-binding protein [Oceanirhabdus seepicola]MCM1991215.1 PAS domain-containing protein [Oceanirhabdus seepicola]
MIVSFLHNIIVVSGFIFISIKIGELFSKKQIKEKYAIWVLALWGSILSIITISEAFQYKGMNFDIRAVPIFLIAHLLGIKAGLVSAILPSLYRWYIGGPTALVGIISGTLLPALIGGIFYKKKIDRFTYLIKNTKRIMIIYLFQSLVRSVIFYFTLEVSFIFWLIINVLMTLFSEAALFIILSIAKDNNKKIFYINEINNKQKEVELLNDRLKTKNNTLNALINVMPVGVIVSDANGKITLTNTAADNILEDKAHKLGGISINDNKIEKVYTLHTIDGREISQEEHPLVRSIKNGEVIKEQELLVRTKDKKEKVILGGTSPVYDYNNKIIHGVGIFKDITKEKKAKEIKNALIEELSNEREKLEKKNQQLILLTEQHMRTLESLYRKNEELKIANKAKSSFIANISHELRTPLNIIMTYLEYILEEEDGKLNIVQKDMLQTTYNNSDRLKYLINDLLDLSRLETNKNKFNFTAIGVNKFLTSLIIDRSILIKDKDTNISFNPLENELYIIVDELRLRQVIDNIIDNAIKFSNDGDIEISLKEIEGYIEICIKDYGVGIEPEKIEDIFKPFYQIDDSTKKKYKGVGLGLSIVKKIIEAFGGNVFIKNNDDKGCTFKITVPVDCSAKGGN